MYTVTLGNSVNNETHGILIHTERWYFNTGQHVAFSVYVVSCENQAADSTFNHHNDPDTRYSLTITHTHSSQGCQFSEMAQRV